jgi:hypothetical protein
MDAESQLLAEKDAEIDRLEAKVEAVRVELRQQWERMQKENLALKDRVTEKDALITELADALVRVNYSWPNEYDAALLQRAQEATK